MKRLPKFLKEYFWDVDFNKLDYKSYPRFVIERILEYGNISAIAWMMKHFSRPQIIDTFQKTKQLSAKSAHFWALILNLKESKVKCLQRSFQEIRKQFWPY